MAKINKTLATAIVLSLFISMMVGGLFGFLSSLVINRNIETNIEKKIFSEDFTQKIEENYTNMKNQQLVNQNENESNLVNVVDRTQKSVVSIIISKDMPVIERYYSDPFGDGFFNFGFPEDREVGTKKQEIGGGSGFIVSSDGYVVTNRHVVEDAQAEYTVVTNDKKVYEAKVLGRDPINDLAIIKIDPKLPIKGEPISELPYLELGDSSTIKIAQTVVAIGNSLGEFQNTVSKGIVSGLSRNIIAGGGMSQAESLNELIQTDAAVNTGNSGGPLLDLSGKVIGVNVAMAQDAENISFAIPINIAKPIIQSVRTEGRIIRPFIGIRYVMINEQIAKDNNLPYTEGALIMGDTKSSQLGVVVNSPAAKAGLKDGDLILEIDGKKINSEYTPGTAISLKQPNDIISVKIYSDGKEKNVDITLTEREE